MAETVDFENDRVRVLRVKLGGHERRHQSSRLDRLIIYLHDGHIRRTENAKTETHQRKAGDVIWRNRSQHEIENLKDSPHEVIIVEFKR